MELLDGTIVTTATPAMSRSLHVHTSAVGLTITSYFLCVGAFIPLSAWLARRLGDRNTFVGAIITFTLASLLCAASPNLSILVAARCVQGVGGALMVPVGRQVVFAGAEKSDITRLMGYIVWPALLAPVLAPIAGGVVVTQLSWRWLFLINGPLGALAAAAALKLLTRRGRSISTPLDIIGLALTVTGLGLVTFTLYEISADIRWWVVAPLAACATFVAWLAIRHLLRTSNALVDLRPLRIETFRVAQASGFIYFLAVGATPFLLTLMFQEEFGWSPTRSGSMVLFIFAGNALIKPATTPLLNWFGFRTILLVCTVTLAVITTGLSFISAQWAWPLIGLTLAVSGIARSVGLTAYSTLALSDIPSALMRDANVLASTLQQVAGGFAVALASVLLAVGSTAHGQAASVNSPTDFAVAFGALSILLLATVLRLTRLPATTGQNLMNRPRAPVAASNGNQPSE